MADEAQTQPMLETIIKELRDFRSEFELRFDKVETQLDRVISVAHESRADVRELRKHLREHLNLSV